MNNKDEWYQDLRSKSTSDLLECYSALSLIERWANLQKWENFTSAVHHYFYDFDNTCRHYTLLCPKLNSTNAGRFYLELNGRKS